MIMFPSEQGRFGDRYLQKHVMFRQHNEIEVVESSDRASIIPKIAVKLSIHSIHLETFQLIIKKGQLE